MSYSRAFERTMLKRELDGEKGRAIAPPNGAQGDKNNYIGFLEGQLDKIAATSEFTKLLSDKVENLHTTLTIHEERLLNQARLLNLTQEAIDQGNQQHGKAMSSLKDHINMLDNQLKSLQDQVCATSLSVAKCTSDPAGLPFPEGVSKEEYNRLLAMIYELQDAQKQHSKQLSLLHTDSEDSLTLMKVKGQLDSLDTYIQKSIAELKTEAVKSSQIEGTVLGMVPELKASILTACESELMKKLTNEISSQISKSMKSLADNLLLAILPEVKLHVKDSIKNIQAEIRRETMALNSALNNLNEDMNQNRKRVSSTQGEVETLVNVMEDIRKQIRLMERGEITERARAILQSSPSRQTRESPRLRRSTVGDSGEERELRNGIWTDQKRIYTTFHPLDDRQYVPIAVPTRGSPSPPRELNRRFDPEKMQKRIKYLLTNSPQSHGGDLSVGSDSDSGSNREHRRREKDDRLEVLKRSADYAVHGAAHKGSRNARSSSADGSFREGVGLNAMAKELRNSGKLYSSSSAADGVGRRGSVTMTTHTKGAPSKNRSSYDGHRASTKPLSSQAASKSRR